MTDIVYSLAACGDTAFSASSTGLLRSLDAGRTWSPVRLDSGLVIPASAVVFSPQFPADQIVFAAVPGGILRSLDGGNVWASAQLPTPAPFITSMAVSPDFEHDRMLFAASLEDGVYRSIDGGANWASWNFGLLDFQVLSLMIASGDTLYAGTGTGLFVSQNAGRAWIETTLPCGHSPILCLASAPGLLLVGTEGSGLYASLDDSQSWQQLGNDKTQESINALILDGNMIIAATQDVLMISRDAGQIWDRVLGLPEDDLPSQLAAPYGLAPGAALLVGCSSGHLCRIELI